MRRKIFDLLVLTVFMSIPTIVQAAGLGVGWTFDTGIHARLGNLETQFVFGSPAIFGLRWYPLRKPIQIREKKLDLYAGPELDIISGDESGLIVGGFTGLQKPILKNFYLSLDLGIFSVSAGSVSDIGVALNTKVTYFLRR